MDEWVRRAYLQHDDDDVPTCKHHASTALNHFPASSWSYYGLKLHATTVHVDAHTD
jgi:hypothetical protein